MMMDISTEIKQALTEIGSYISEDIRRRLREEKGDTAVEQTIEFHVEGLTVSVSAEDYLKYIDQGRAPGTFPPVSAIESWIERKGIQPRDMGLPAPTTNQLAFLIGRSISENGIEPANVIQPEDHVITDLVTQAGFKGITATLDKHVK